MGLCEPCKFLSQSDHCLYSQVHFVLYVCMTRSKDGVVATLTFVRATFRPRKAMQLCFAFVLCDPASYYPGDCECVDHMYDDSFYMLLLLMHSVLYALYSMLCTHVGIACCCVGTLWTILRFQTPRPRTCAGHIGQVQVGPMQTLAKCCRHLNLCRTRRLLSFGEISTFLIV